MCSAIATASMLGERAWAQESADSGDYTLDVVVVTAQKRAQNVQDVPIAVTALDAQALASNRVVNVTDLSSLAPGLTVRQSAGGSKLPSFSIRGAVSYGVVPGSDKQVSLYLDGVYISSPNGSTFDLPDLERIEVLRGPQGTLFGRNATAGAVSVTTRDPTGEFGGKASATVGNRGHFRYHGSLDLPEMGPFSGYVSFQHEEKRGDIRNNGAGRLWDRRNSQVSRVSGIDRSPKRLGSKDSDAVFAALKFEAADFTTVYKYDYFRDQGTPEGTAVVALDSTFPLIGSFLTTLISSQPSPVAFARDNRRPEAVNNAWAAPFDQTVQGHSLTSTLRLSDDLSIKNIFAYRKSYIFAATSLDGFSSLTLTPQALGPYATFVAFSTNPGLAQASPAVQAGAIQQIAAALGPAVGQPFIGISTQISSRSVQLSDEVQLNYDSRRLTATAGAVWFRSKDYTAELRLNNTIQFQPIFNGVLLNNNIGEALNKATSIAAYTQLEWHASNQIDLVLGGRVTRDKKTSSLITGANLSSLGMLIPPTYKKTKANYLIGANYKPTQDILLYAKYSTAYVSGGAVAGVPFDPETVKSWEGGLKAELLDGRLRANLALYHAAYKSTQTAQSATNYVDQITEITGDPNRSRVIGTLVVASGDVTAKGVEFEMTAAPTRGLTLGGSLGYTKTTADNLNPRILAANRGRYRIEVFRPEWTGSLWAQYDTPPVFGDAFVSARANANWQSKMALAFNPDLPIYQVAPASVDLPAYWLVNARLALSGIKVGGLDGELALWGKNLTDERKPSFNLLLQFVTTANFIPARSYGVDLTVKF